MQDGREGLLASKYNIFFDYRVFDVLAIVDDGSATYRRPISLVWTI